MVNRRGATSQSTSPANGGLSLNPFDTEPETYSRRDTTQDAAATSRKIEAWLLEGKQALERRRKGVKILLLGKLFSWLFIFASELYDRPIRIGQGMLIVFF
jgi:hypothetical protein